MANSPTYANHYQILLLPQPSNTGIEITEEQIKKAYKRCLLHYHPDKRSCSGTTSPWATQYTVDQIVEAYSTLINPQTRLNYDRSLTLASLKNSRPFKEPHSGFETVDLDDLIMDEQQGKWYRACRCGVEDGFTVSETALAQNIEHGEVFVECHGCSLIIRVAFTETQG
ncbi:MAG: hypothetical protein Q9190_003294 [Brigantiaea leucoxantha]